MEELQVELQRTSLKLDAYRESFTNKISRVMTEYEDRIADLRVELTLMNQQLQEERRKNAELEELSVQQKPEETTDED